MTNDTRKTVLASALTLCLSTPTLSQGWWVSSQLHDISASNNLPVDALGSRAWADRYRPSDQTSRAWRSLGAQINLQHPNGSAVGLLIRSEADLSASADTVAAAALVEQKRVPAENRAFLLEAGFKSWTGHGLHAHTPWLSLPLIDSGLRLRLNGQLLQLTRLRQGSGGGFLNYSPLLGYESNLSYERNYHTTRQSFMAAPEATGLGYSVSLQLQRAWEDGMQVHLELRDIHSNLRWTLLKESTTLTAYPSNDIPVDYRGQSQRQTTAHRMEPSVGFAWHGAKQGADRLMGAGKWTAQLQHRNKLTQMFFGRASSGYPAVASDQPADRALNWHLAIDPINAAWMAQGSWRGLSLAYGSHMVSNRAYYRLVQMRGSWQF
jgi:hypothetical protein